MMLPNGWKKVKLGDILTAVDYGTAAKSDAIGKYPVLRMGNLENGYLVWDDLVYSSSEEEYAKYELKKGDILFNRTNSRDKVGKTSIYRGERPSIFAGYLIRLKVNNECDPYYVNYCMNSKRFAEFCKSVRTDAIGQSNINAQVLQTYDFSLPPIEEQKKIAATLSVWDSAIEKMEKLLEAKIVQKNSLTYKLIENQNDVKFKLGNVTIDKSKWEKKSLKEFGSFSKGQGIKRDEAHSGSIAAVRYGEIYTTHNDYIKEFHSFISEDVAKKSKLLKKGDLLFSCSGETKEDIGKCVAFVSNVVAYAGGDIIIFSPQIECDSKYLGFLLNARSINKQKYGLGQGDSIVHISAESIGRLTVFLPSYPEQKVIADVLSAIDDELALLKQQLENYKKQKQGLMQKLLTGQWRVK